MSNEAVQSQWGNWCRHYNGLMNETCKAGVRYADVKLSPPVPLGYPCFKDKGCTHLCALVSFPTLEEIEQEKQQARESLERYLGKIAENICPHCETPITEQVQVGRCAYAKPCGHRLFQGKAKTKEKTWKDHPYFRE